MTSIINRGRGARYPTLQIISKTESIRASAMLVRDADNPIDKVKESWKTVRDCMKCGTDAIKDGIAR